MLFALALAALQGVAPAHPTRTLRVGPGAEFASPAAALAAARPGDTVRVAAGTHRGPLVLRMPGLVLLGDSGAVLDGQGRGSVVTLAADSVALVGFAVRGSGRDLGRDEAAVKLVRCSGCAVRGNRISNSLHGVYLLESAAAELSDNHVVGDPALAEARRGNGIHLFHSPGTRILRNRIEGTRDGIYFSFSSDSEVVENEVSGVRYGLHYMYSNDNRFRRNRFTRNAAGAAIMFSRRIVFEENVFARHVGYRAYGILLQTAYEVEARRNRIEGNLVGVFLDMSSGNTFRENAITGNGIGIDLIASAEENTFVGNAITGNRIPVRKPYGEARNTWAVEGRGNYWGVREIFDLDRDGIGDRPYRAGDAFSSLAAARPVLEVFAGTPAAVALAWAEEAFPVFDLPRVEDPAPLAAPPPGAPRARAGPSERGRSRAGASLLLLIAPAVAGLRRARRNAQKENR